MKKVIRLLGIGGNFKTSILNAWDLPNYIKIPECNSEFQSELTKFNLCASTAHNFAVKKLVTRVLINNNPESNVITDRALFDYYIFNELLHLGYNWEYAKSYCKDLVAENEPEKDLFKEFKIYNVLLVTLDRDFVYNIIDNSNSERANYFEHSDQYFECQDLYIKIVQKFIDYEGSKLLRLDLSNIKLTKLDTTINSLIKSIKKFVNE